MCLSKCINGGAVGASIDTPRLLDLYPLGGGPHRPKVTPEWESQRSPRSSGFRARFGTDAEACTTNAGFVPANLWCSVRLHLRLRRAPPYGETIVRLLFARHWRANNRNLSWFVSSVARGRPMTQTERQTAASCAGARKVNYNLTALYSDTGMKSTLHLTPALSRGEGERRFPFRDHFSFRHCSVI